MQVNRKTYAGGLLLLMVLMVLLYLLLESRQRTVQIDRVLKNIPSSPK